MANPTLTLEDVNIKDVYTDLHTAIYMLHYLEDDLFTKEEVRDVLFSLKVILSSIDKIMKGETTTLMMDRTA